MHQRTSAVGTIAAMAALLVGMVASPAAASGAPAGSFVLVTCTDFIPAGLQHTNPPGNGDPTAVHYEDAVRLRACFYKTASRQMYAKLQWYMPYGGYIVGSAYAAVEDCTASGDHGGVDHGYSGDPKYEAGTDTAHLTNEYSTAFTAVSGHTYRAKTYVGGVGVENDTSHSQWLLDRAYQKPDVYAFTSCVTP